MEETMLTFCFMAIIHVMLLTAAIWILVIEMKLFFYKEYRKYPPFVPSFGAEKKNIISNIRNVLKNSLSNMTILDPGCGTGTLLFELAKEFPNHKFVGIEWNKFAYFICRLRAKKYNNVKIYCDDMFNCDIGGADIIVCFLIEPLMKKFGQKIMRDNYKTQIIFSNTFKIPNLPLVEKIKTGKGSFFKGVYVYKL